MASCNIHGHDDKKQHFKPLNDICGHLNAFHVYATEPGRFLETKHYCAQLNKDFRQCLLYDFGEKDARLIGSMFYLPLNTRHQVFESLPQEERYYWHSHVFEVTSGMLITPKPPGLTDAEWDPVESKEMEDLIHVYGKVYHLWQVDRGDQVPMGSPSLMASFTHSDEIPKVWKKVAERDQKINADCMCKRHIRKDIEAKYAPKTHADSDQAKNHMSNFPRKSRDNSLKALYVSR
ncbi:DUF1264-domain-containing protein [Pholiota conissans]|uniref:DUF1264-domain-containing protein n=1 Tax=Pholiota conissans TaxID=109636 RepID=A0A9P6CY04_9AGAR|nr:DUF1264-domain-containing protein [Pholiota conissans]